MSIWRRIRGIGWLIALVTTAAAIITRTVVSLRGRQPETVVDAIPAPPVASELAPPRPVEEIEIHLPAPSIWPAAAGLGIALGFFGIVTSLFVGLVGILVFVVAVAGWIGELVHEHNG